MFCFFSLFVLFCFLNKEEKIMLKEFLKNVLSKMSRLINMNDEGAQKLIETEYMSYELYYEKKRLKTFEGVWPHSFIDEKLLAKTGFYYLGEEDRVECVFCGIELYKWILGDNELFEHMRWSPNCPLLKRQEIRNVPLDPMDLIKVLPPVSYDTCGIYDLTINSDNQVSTPLKSLQPATCGRNLEKKFFINDNKSIAFVFVTNQKRFKLQNIYSDNHIFLTKETLRDLFSGIKRCLNINTEHPVYRKIETDSIKNKINIFSLSENSYKIEFEKNYLNVLIGDLINILDIELFMPFLYINYLD